MRSADSRTLCLPPPKGGANPAAASHPTCRGYIDNHIKPNIGNTPLEKLPNGLSAKAVMFSEKMI